MTRRAMSRLERQAEARWPACSTRLAFAGDPADGSVAEPVCPRGPRCRCQVIVIVEEVIESPEEVVTRA